MRYIYDKVILILGGLKMKRKSLLFSYEILIEMHVKILTDSSKDTF